MFQFIWSFVSKIFTSGGSTSTRALLCLWRATEAEGFSSSLGGRGAMMMTTMTIVTTMMNMTTVAIVTTMTP